jgi:hypothetical protein
MFEHSRVERVLGQTESEKSMRKVFTIFILSAIIGLCSAAVSAQRPVRITFAKGQKTKVITGTMNGYRSIRNYVIRVRKGQVLTTEAVKQYITIGVEAPPGSDYEQDMAADCHDRNEVTPTAAGDYQISVTECKKADAWRGTFKFRITVK